MENIFNLIPENYEPATNFADADFTPTTEEILQKIARHTGKEDLTLEACYNYLKESGFLQMNLSELYFVWLMRSKGSVLFNE